MFSVSDFQGVFIVQILDCEAYLTKFQKLNLNSTGNELNEF